MPVCVRERVYVGARMVAHAHLRGGLANVRVCVRASVCEYMRV